MGVTGLLPRWFGRLVAALPDPGTMLVGLVLGVVAAVIAHRVYTWFLASTP